MENNNTKGEIVWRDKKTIEIVRLVIFLIITIFFGYGIIISKNTIDKVMSIVLSIVFLWFLYRQLKRRLSYIAEKGIRIGNIFYKLDDKIFVKQKSILVSWNNIKSLKITSKGYYGPLGGRSFNHLVLKIKEGRRYDCLVYDPQGFVNALKKLKKYHLLLKESRYGK